MKLLLDTHIWLWSLLEPNRLGKRVRQALRSSGNELWLSPISTWEFLILAERGRVTLNLEVDVWLDQAFGVAPLREAPITHEIARRSRSVPLTHGDPADRFLVATALELDLRLVTADERLLRAPGVPLMANR